MFLHFLLASFLPPPPRHTHKDKICGYDFALLSVSPYINILITSLDFIKFFIHTGHCRTTQGRLF